MTMYRCTVEVREKDGCMHHYTSEIEAPDGDAAAARAREAVEPELKAHGGEDRVEEIVCMVVEPHH
ncbi:MAG: hypothetical protein JJT90_09460 [Ectothiorhodospiraceae bacterium]|nr:hypothetical protein [Ectothiorhodospiraceae bacterium]